jgi:hypothetical protein
VRTIWGTAFLAEMVAARVSLFGLLVSRVALLRTWRKATALVFRFI